MSKISLKHSGGNVVSLNSPTNAPSAADVAFKLPNADGSAGQFMKTDGSGNLAFDTITIPAGGITMLDVWTISTTADATSSGGDLTTNWVRANAYQAVIGSAMTQSSGVFTFPSTGIYEVLFNAQFRYGNPYTRRYTTAYLDKVISGSASVMNESASHISGISGNTYSIARCTAYFDVTDVSTHKVQFRTRAEGSPAVTTDHSNSYLTTFASFKKLGDT